jgi:hypothetical protein
VTVNTGAQLQEIQQHLNFNGVEKIVTNNGKFLLQTPILTPMGNNTWLVMGVGAI